MTNKKLAGLIIGFSIGLTALLAILNPNKVPVKSGKFRDYDVAISNINYLSTISIQSGKYSIVVRDKNRNDKFDEEEIITNAPEGHELRKYANPTQVNLIYNYIIK